MSVLSTRDLSVMFGPRRVLDAVTAEFRPGHITAVVGPNGAGKSTLLAALAGLRPGSEGDVWLGAAPLSRLNPRERARRIGFLPQTAEVAWALDVRTLVSLGLLPFGSAAAGSHEALIETALQTLRVADLANRTIDTLSGGERGRVLLARAIVGNPEWLIADEPLAGLDPGHVLESCEILSRRARESGHGVILTLHDLTTAYRIADRVIVLAEGRIIADGPPAAAITPAVVEKAYGVEAEVSNGQGGGLIDILRRSGTSPA